MKILNILVNGQSDDAELIINEHKTEHDVEVIDLSKGEIAYDELVDKIEQCDKVITW